MIVYSKPCCFPYLKALSTKKIVSGLDMSDLQPAGRRDPDDRVRQVRRLVPLALRRDHLGTGGEHGLVLPQVRPEGLEGQEEFVLGLREEGSTLETLTEYKDKQFYVRGIRFPGSVYEKLFMKRDVRVFLFFLCL